MKRSKHSLSHYVLSTFDMGQLVPVSNFEVLPGDSVRMSSSCLLRVSPLLTPVMHPVTVRLHHWFVPHRLTWDGWEDFITGGPDGMDASVVPAVSGVTVEAGSVADYMGVPPGANRTYNRFPIAAYYLVFNEFYRDQDLVTLDDPLTATGRQAATLRNVAWEKDYFTAARPWVQKGPDITLPLGTIAPVVGVGGPPTFDVGSGSGVTLGQSTAFNAVWSAGSADPTAVWNDPQLQADLSSATAVNVNDVRLAFALQRYEEARAQYGSRYVEYLRYLGVRSSDARLQRPEYLGGGRATIAFSEVLRTGSNTDAASPGDIGDMSGHGISAMRSRRFVRFFEEHGTVLTLASVRPRSMYGNGLFRSWSRTTKEDFWQKELELIGQQEVLNQEVYIDDSAPGDVFGYQDRYAEYRHLPSRVAGDFRTTLNDWHLARIFGADVALNSTFVQCVPTKRVHAVQTEDVLWGMFNHSIQARRMVGKRTIGRIM